MFLKISCFSCSVALGKPSLIKGLRQRGTLLVNSKAHFTIVGFWFLNLTIDVSTIHLCFQNCDMCLIVEGNFSQRTIPTVNFYWQSTVFSEPQNKTPYISTLCIWRHTLVWKPNWWQNKEQLTSRFEDQDGVCKPKACFNQS